MKRVLLFPTLSVALIVASLFWGPLVRGEGPFNFGRAWNSFSPDARNFYAHGFLEGERFLATMVSTEMARISEKGNTATPYVDAIQKVLKHAYAPESVQAAMSELYREPANAGRPFSIRADRATSKLQGEAIEPKLDAARKMMALTAPGK